MPVYPLTLRAMFLGLVLTWFPLFTAYADEVSGIRPLHGAIEAVLLRLPPDTHYLFDPSSIAQFLAELDGDPPDWAAVYGYGHHDPGHDDRLFTLNRERDAKREGKPALHQRIAFLWFGELSRFDEEEQGFRVALGPRFNPTPWGDVRFKHEDLPATLIAQAGPATAALKVRFRQERTIPIDVVVVGRLIPAESIVYDFSHEEEGRGLIMPVVQVEAVEFVLNESSARRQ
ncbi:hypothetical protein FBQ96_11700 [Nitrospirales bacterium NOB]|nr:hypothetical protein [Nitrospirota bacterium]MDL1890226.1 hypothetical protein [Nitrospirales bacterium NOB]MEB2338494.1 hypothetical protein [Nitrospirales bacterium]QOJ33945.1 MAG: hypothetical protein HRU82_02820 [Nitrospira sp.]